MRKVQGIVDVMCVPGHLSHNLPGFQIPSEAMFSFMDPTFYPIDSFQADYTHSPSSIGRTVDSLLTNPCLNSAPPPYYLRKVTANLPHPLFPVASRTESTIPSSSSRPTISRVDQLSPNQRTVYPVPEMTQNLQLPKCQFDIPDTGFSIASSRVSMRAEIAPRMPRAFNHAGSGDRMHAAFDNTVEVKDVPCSRVRTFSLTNEPALVTTARKELESTSSFVRGTSFYYSEE